MTRRNHPPVATRQAQTTPTDPRAARPAVGRVSVAEVTARQRRRIRAALAERDGTCCWYCGCPFGPHLAGATLDHLVPKSRVRTWALAALVLACEPCNQAKADRLPQALLRPAAGRFGPGLVPGPAARAGHDAPSGAGSGTGRGVSDPGTAGSGGGATRYGRGAAGCAGALATMAVEAGR